MQIDIIGVPVQGVFAQSDRFAEIAPFRVKGD